MSIDALKSIKLSYYCKDPTDYNAICLLIGDETVKFSQEIKAYSVQSLSLNSDVEKSEVSLIKDEAVINALLKVLDEGLSNSNVLILGSIQVQVIKIILGQIEYDKVNHEIDNSLISILSRNNKLLSFFEALQRHVHNEEVLNNGQQIPIELLELSISTHQQTAIETSFSILSRNTYPLQAILYNCNTLTFHESKKGQSDYFLKHATITHSVNERKIHSIFSHKNMSVDHYKNLTQTIKNKQGLPSLVIFSMNDLAEGDPLEIVEVFERC
mmetsp:Transcript_9491/g.9019  ORF Transcript_9491/g.9019 Transcript_9491/m.9019 type:complete len:270 (+) Transcript_9491:1454-2263(+)